jgi:transposase InsO family protein
MREQGASIQLCSAALGISPSTVQRYKSARQRVPKSVVARDAARCQQARSIVRATHGLVGAASLGRMTGLPRRACAEIKKHELRELELERKARCASVSVLAPGLVRGFDAMHVDCTEGKAYWLVAADAAVPYRTSIATVPAYDAEHVIAALVADFEAHGPPLVLRLDRIACQRTPAVYAMLSRYNVLPLHGPPRHPYYYGQLERQNREHRAWYALLGAVSRAELGRRADSMRTALNALWPRPTLDGWTAEQAWDARTTINVDRRELIAEVQHAASRLITTGHEALHAHRIATESALIRRGLLTVNLGGSC